jgi:PAS domain S-box-containing protein
MDTSRFRRLLTPPVFDDGRRNDTARLVYGAAAAFAVIGAPAIMLLAVAFRGSGMRWTLMALVGEVICIAVMWVTRRGHPTIASYVMILGVAAFAGWSAWTGGGMDSMAIAAVILLVMLAGMLIGWVAALVTAAAASAVMLAMALLQTAGMMPPSSVSTTPVLRWAVLSIFVAIAAGLQLLSSRTVQDALLRARRELAERQATEVALRTSEQTLRATLDASPFAIALIANDGTLEYINPTATATFGYTLAEVPSVAAWFGRVYPDASYRESIRHTWEQDVAAMRRDGTPIPERLRDVTCADGSVRHMALLTSVTDDRLIVAFADLTDRIEAEDALRASERRLHEIVDNAPFGAHSWELRGNGDLVFVGANRSADDILGIDHGALVGLPIEEAFPGLVGTPTPDAYRAVARGAGRWEADQFAYDAEGIAGVFEVHALQVGPGRMVAFFRDVTEKRKADIALQAKTDELDRFFSLSLDLLAIIGADAAFQRVNPAWESVLGYPMAEMQGASYLTWVHPDDLDRTREAFRELDSGRVLTDFVNRYRAAGGEYRWIEWRVAPFADGIAYAAARDITEWVEARERVARLNDELEQRVELRTRELASANEALSRANQELEATNVRLEEATQAKTRFLANMSHELRTPLNAIIGFSNILGREMPGPLNDEQQRQVDMISGAGRHLLDLINQALDLSRIEAGRLHVDLDDFYCEELISDAIETIRPLAEERGLELVVSGAGGGCVVHTDRMRVEQVLLNLLGNAVKFTDSGSVELRADVDDGELVFTVSDTGIGIAPADLPRVFDEFYQARPASDAKRSGTGLGLAVSKQIVEMLGGTISVGSTLAEGSAFTVRLPVAGPSDSADPDNG